MYDVTLSTRTHKKIVKGIELYFALFGDLNTYGEWVRAVKEFSGDKYGKSSEKKVGNVEIGLIEKGNSDSGSEEVAARTLYRVERLREYLLGRALSVSGFEKYFWGKVDDSVELWIGGLSWLRGVKVGMEYKLSKEQVDFLLFAYFLGDVFVSCGNFFKVI